MTAPKEIMEDFPQFHHGEDSFPADKARHDRIVGMIRQMLALHKQLAAANTGHEKTVVQRQIDATDRQIDLLLYELYDLTDKEIAIVEETTASRK